MGCDDEMVLGCKFRVDSCLLSPLILAGVCCTFWALHMVGLFCIDWWERYTPFAFAFACSILSHHHHFSVTISLYSNAFPVSTMPLVLENASGSNGPSPVTPPTST